MNFNGDFQKIGDFDITAILDRVQSLSDDIWYQETDRQKQFEVHKYTQTLKILHDADFRHENPTVHDNYKHLKDVVNPVLKYVVKHYSKSLKYQRLQKKNGKGYFIRVILTRLDPGGAINQHTDNGYSLSRCHRIHLPIVTNEKVFFHVGETIKTLKAGEIWEINNRHVHAVENKSNERRIHMIMDYVLPGEKVIDTDGKEIIC